MVSDGVAKKALGNRSGCAAMSRRDDGRAENQCQSAEPAVAPNGQDW